MLIKAIKLNTTSTLYGLETNSFSFINNFNLLSSNGINSRGKTSLIKFLIWGLGYNISFTKSFNRQTSEVKLLLLNNKQVIHTDRVFDRIKIRKNNTMKEFHLPKQESNCIQYLFGFNNTYLEDQLIGLFYFDQDQGLKEWNRGKVVQSLNYDKTYRLSIEQILFGLINLDYSKYHKRELKLCHEQAHIKKLIKSVTPFIKSSSMDKFNFNEAKRINNNIYKTNTILQRLKKFYKIYTESRKKEKKVFKLLKVLNLYIENPNPNGNPIPVKKENIIKNNLRDLQLSYISKSYRIRIHDIRKHLKILNSKRNSLIKLRINNTSNYDKDYLNAQKEVALSGLNIRHLKNNQENLNSNRKKIHKKIYNILVNNQYYNKIWNTAHKLSQNLTIKNYFSIKKNKILYKSIPYSGAQRSLIIFIYRLAIYSTVMSHLQINIPIILDSPGSQEMDNKNLNSLLRTIIKEMPKTQLIVASNDKINIPNHKINLNNGVFNDL